MDNCPGDHQEHVRCIKDVEKSSLAAQSEKIRTDLVGNHFPAVVEEVWFHEQAIHKLLAAVVAVLAHLRG